MKQATLTITVEYDELSPNSTIESLLRDVARSAAGNGLLTGDGEITLENWECDVKISRETPERVQAFCEDAHGITWALFADGTYGSRFGNLASWKPQLAPGIADSILNHLADGGDN